MAVVLLPLRLRCGGFVRAVIADSGWFRRRRQPLRGTPGELRMSHFGSARIGASQTMREGATSPFRGENFNFAIVSVNSVTQHRVCRPRDLTMIEGRQPDALPEASTQARRFPSPNPQFGLAPGTALFRYKRSEKAANGVIRDQKWRQESNPDPPRSAPIRPEGVNSTR